MVAGPEPIVEDAMGTHRFERSTGRPGQGSSSASRVKPRPAAVHP